MAGQIATQPNTSKVARHCEGRVSLIRREKFIVVCTHNRLKWTFEKHAPKLVVSILPGKHASFKISKLRSLGKASGLRELFFRFTEREGESAERDIRFLRIIRAKWK
jgi:hypothetical protein